MILLAVAVEAELGPWRPPAGVATLFTGVGPVEASCALAQALALRTYRLVVNAGLAGALDGAAQIGDGVVIAQDAMELARENGALALPPGVTVASSAASDAALVERLTALGFAALRGITVSRVTSTGTTARRLARELGAQVESMEGFAVLRAAHRAGVRAVEVRGISNRCGDRSASGWDFTAGTAGLRAVLDALFGLSGLRADGTQ